MALQNIIENSQDKRHDLFTWITNKFDHVFIIQNSGDISDDNGNNLASVKHLYEELNDFFRCFSVMEAPEELESHYLFIRLSQLYCLTLDQLKAEEPGKIFDAAELLINILNEEDVSQTNQEDSSKKSKKKKSPKKHYKYTPVKAMTAVLLIQFVELFSSYISALFPLLYTTIFKNLKKIFEKSKYKNASFIVSLMGLLKVVLRKDNSNDNYPLFFPKFTRLSKTIFEEIYENDELLPVDAVSMIIDSWSTIMTKDNFINEHGELLMDTVLNKFLHGELGIFGFVNDETRIHTAKALAEVLFNFYHHRNLIDLEEVMSDFVKIFSNSRTRDIKSGCFEAIVYFISLSISANKDFLKGDSYLNIIKQLSPVLSGNKIEGLKRGTVARYLRYFIHLHKILFPFISESSKLQMLIVLTSDAASTYSKSRDYMSVNIYSEEAIKNEPFVLLKLDLLDFILTDLSSTFVNETHVANNLKSTLLELCVSEVFEVRLHAIKVTKLFLTNNPDLIANILEDSLSILSQDFKKSENLVYTKLHGNALLIACLIDICDSNYVPYELIMQITVFSTSFIKNNTTSTSANLYFKGLICWILLIGLMNYSNEYYLRMQTSQLFLFWKVILTHSFSYHHEEELTRNLEIRTHALTCVLTYLNNAKISKETAKQISYLLTKCSNFNNSVNIKSKTVDRLLLSNENKILQIYLKIKDYIKYDFNSSLLILIVKNFSDSNLYTEPSGSLLPSISKLGKRKTKEEKEKDSTVDLTVDGILRQQGDFAYGLSSKVQKNTIQHITTDEPKVEITSIWSDNKYKWYENLENEVVQPVSAVLSNDSLILLYGKLSYFSETKYLPRITTSLVDFSMELFSTVFPYLNTKIQYSVLENLNLSLFSRATSPLRNVAITANVCVSLHHSLRIIHENQMKMDKAVGDLIIESLKKIEFYNDTFLTSLKSDCLGLVCAAVNMGLSVDRKKEFIKDHVNILIKQLIDIDEPYLRMFFVLSITSIYKYNTAFASFEAISGIVLTLIKDPHPVIHSWSLRALLQLLEKHAAVDVQWISTLMLSLENYLANPNYGMYGQSMIRYNYNSEYNSHKMIVLISKTLTEKIGPTFVELKDETIVSFKNITLGSILSNNIACIMQSLKIFENIATFKLHGLLNNELYIYTIGQIIKNSAYVGIGTSNFISLFTANTDLFPFTTSKELVFEGFSQLIQLLKLGKKKLFDSNIALLPWIYLSLYPDSNSIRVYLKEWLLNTSKEPEWLERLYIMFNSSNEFLFEEVFTNIKKAYQKEGNDLTDITKKHKEINESNNELIFSADKIRWESKNVILDLVIELCSLDNSSTASVSKIDNLDNLMKIAFQAANARVECLNIQGLAILKLIISMARSQEVATSEHLLIQQEAQISSALMSVFQKGSSSTTIARAIDVCADVLTSGSIPIDRLGRLSSLLRKLLGIFNDNSSSIEIGEVTLLTKKSRSEVEIAVLDAWARITKTAINLGNNGMIGFVKPFWQVLTPLWILSLREYMMLRYDGQQKLSMTLTSSELDTSKIALYETVWVDFVEVLGLILVTDKQIVTACLNEEELESLLFVITSRCFEILCKNPESKNKHLELLVALHNILNSTLLLESLLKDEIFEDFVAIMERLINSSSNEENMSIANIISDIITSYTKRSVGQEEFLRDIDKIYELLRLIMMMVTKIIPFISLGYSENHTDGISVSDIHLLKRIFVILEINVSNFGPIFKLDLYACLLFLFSKVFCSPLCNEIVPVILPLLKRISQMLVPDEKHGKLLSIFFNSIKDNFVKSLNEQNTLSTIFIFLTSGFTEFNQEDLQMSRNIIIESLINGPALDITVRCLRNIVIQKVHTKSSLLIMRDVYQYIITDDLKIDEIEWKFSIIGLLLSSFVEDIDEKKATAALALVLIYITRVPDTSISRSNDSLVNIFEIVESKPDLFRATISQYLTEDQKQRITEIIQKEINIAGNIKDDVNNLPLKTFV